MTTQRNVVIAIGNPFRSDDGVAQKIVEALRLPQWEKRVLSGEGLDLMPVWENREWVAVIDAAKGLGPAGSTHLFDVTNTPLPTNFARTSSHAMGLSEAIELSRALGSLPKKLWVFAIEGMSFESGTALSPSLGAKLPELVQWVQDTLGAADA